MPNAALISTLETLREVYNQQHKNAANLQSAFKGVTNALTKAGKTLRDYAEQNNAAQVSDAQNAFAALRLKDETIDPLLPVLRREIKTLAHLAAALKDAAAALKVTPVDVVRLDHAYTGLKDATQADIQDVLPQLDEELQLAQRALGEVFGQALRAALAEQGISIGGRPPKFEIGRFEIDADFAKRSAVLRYGKDVVVPRIPTSLEAFLKAHQTAAKSVTGRSEDGKKWLEQLYTAYENARRKRESDSRVNLVDCYVEMVILRQGRGFLSEPSKRSLAEYTRAQFIYDFYEFTNRQHLGYNGWYVAAHSATKSQADSPLKSMWMVEGDSPYDGRYIADIEFRKA